MRAWLHIAALRIAAGTTCWEHPDKFLARNKPTVQTVAKPTSTSAAIDTPPSDVSTSADAAAAAASKKKIGDLIRARQGAAASSVRALSTAGGRGVRACVRCRETSASHCAMCVV